MAWGSWGQKREPGDGSAVIGADLDSSRLRGVYGPADDTLPRPLLLADGGDDFPLLLDLEHRALALGPAVASKRRRLPHAVCADFLPHLGQPKQWVTGRHKLDATAALVAVAERLRPALHGQPLALALPAYLTLRQVTQLTALLEAARWSVLGTCVAPLALAATAGADDWHTALIADLDGHALTLAVLTRQSGQARLLASVSRPELGRRLWLERLLDGASDRCVQICRRDPRDSATAEQTLYEQIEAALPGVRDGRPVELEVRTAQWYQHLHLPHEELAAITHTLAESASALTAHALQQARLANATLAPVDVCWLTDGASRMPGLLPALTAHLPASVTPKRLPPDDTARAAHALACRFARSDLPRGHLDQVAPLPKG